ncbi:MAG: HEAT repeat domain-containing protein [Aquihabitans sp.]
MIDESSLLVAVWMVGAGLLAALLVLVIAHAYGLALERRRLRLEAEVRPILARFAADEEVDGSSLDALLTTTGVRGRHDAFEVLAGRTLVKLKGESRERLAAWLRERGALDVARARLRSRGRVRRGRAAEVLGVLGSQEDVPALIRVLDDRDSDVRAAAARALGALGAAPATRDLLGHLGGSRPISRITIGWSLLQMPDSVVELLLEGIDSPRGVERALAADVLGLRGAVVAAEPLVAQLADDADAEARFAAARALGRIGTASAVRALEGGLADPLPNLAIACARLLADIGDPSAVPALRVAMGSPDVRLIIQSSRSLVRLGDLGRTALEAVAIGPDTAASYAAGDLAMLDLQSRG